MVVQGPSTLNPNDIDLGGAILYYSTVPYTTFDDAVAGTAWRKFGLMDQGIQMNNPAEYTRFYSGFPARLQKLYKTTDELQISGNLLEVTIRNLARVFGGLTVTDTVKTTAPAPATVGTGSTKTSIIFDDITGFAVNDEIRVGDSEANYQFGRIKRINTSTDTATLYEGLSGDAVPTVGHAIAKVGSSRIILGTNTNPVNFSAKLSHVMPGGTGSYDLYILNAQMDGSPQTTWADNQPTPSPVSIPFSFSAIADDEIENGATAAWDFTNA